MGRTRWTGLTVALVLIAALLGCGAPEPTEVSEASPQPALPEGPRPRTMFVAGPEDSERVLNVYDTSALAAEFHSIEEAAALMDDGRMAPVKLRGQQEMTVLNERPGAYQVRLPDGRTGWVRRESLEAEPRADRMERLKERVAEELDARESPLRERLSEEKRREIFYQAVLAEDRAFELHAAGTDLTDVRVADLGRKTVTDKYGITRNELMEILTEGVARDWPKP